jgi:hypothetical protein
MTYAEDIEGVAEEPIAGVVIGQFGWGGAPGSEDTGAYGFGKVDGRQAVPAELKGRVLTWDVARPLLDMTMMMGTAHQTST